jgi:outer membrane protein TolC
MPSRPIQSLFTAFLVLVFAVPAVLRAQDVDVDGTMPEDSLPGLKPILQAAIQRSPGMIQDQIAIVEAEAGVLGADHSLWPGVGGGAQYGTNRSTTTGGASSDASGFFYNVGANQPVFQWGALANTGKVGRIGLLISKKNYAEAYGQLAVEVREQYMALIGKKLDLRNVRYSLRVAQAQLDVMQKRLGLGEVSRSAVSPAAAAVDGGSLNLERQEDDYETSMRAFADLVGIPGFSDVDIPMGIPSPAYKPAEAATLLTGLLRDNAESTFQAQVYAMQIQQADLNYKIAKVGLYPKLGISTGYSVSNSVTAYPGQITQSVINSFTYNANVNWNIFDGFATRGAKMYALANKRESQRELKNYIESTEAQARHMVRELAISERERQNADDTLQYSRNNVRQTAVELKLGNVAPSAVDSAQANLNDAELSSVLAHANLYSLWTEYVALVGRDPALSNLPPSYVR